MASSLGYSALLAVTDTQPAEVNHLYVGSGIKRDILFGSRGKWTIQLVLSSKSKGRHCLQP